MTPLLACLKGTNNFLLLFLFFCSSWFVLYSLDKRKSFHRSFLFSTSLCKIKCANKSLHYLHIQYLFWYFCTSTYTVFQYKPKFDVQVSACMETVYPRKGLNTKHACWHHQLSKYIKGTVSQEHIEIYPARQ